MRSIEEADGSLTIFVAGDTRYNFNKTVISEYKSVCTPILFFI